MARISAAQWAALDKARDNQFRARLISFIDTQFGRPEGDANLRSPEDIADAALQFADTVGAMTEAQIARIAILLVAVNRRQSLPDEVASVRAALTQAGRTPDERIEAAATVLGISEVVA